MPFLLGTVAARSLHLPHFLLALFALICLHAAGNIVSDIFDFRKGLDAQVTSSSGALARGLLSIRQTSALGGVLASIGIVIGLYLTLTISLNILWIGLAGVLVGFSYSWLKYRALGELAVFISFATLAALGGWTVQAAHFSVIPILWSMPLGLLILAILHANNWHDIDGDRKSGIQTLALLIGRKNSARYYGLLLLLSLVITYAFGQPPTALLALAALPKMVPLWQTVRAYLLTGNEALLINLDGRTAQLHLLFGLLYILGIGLGPLLK